MKKFLFLLGALVAGTGVVLYQVLPASGASTTTVHVIETTISDAPLARGGPAFDPNKPPVQGDGFVFNSTLKTPSGAVTGHDGGVCVFTSPVSQAGGEALCTATAVLARGQVSASGVINVANDTFTIPIIGGSGIYRNAHGEVRGHNINDNDTDLTFVIS